jgi:hypothetical protein
MIWGSGDDLIDLDLELLERLLAVIDQEIEHVEAKSEKHPDPDGFGFYDRIEGLAGLGFVACQQYIELTYRQLGLRPNALQVGPRHPADAAVAEIVNSAANFWKHSGGWDGQDSRERRTRDVLDRIFPSSDPYPLSNILHRLLTPEATRFARVLPVLEEWRNDLLRRSRPDLAP